MTDKKNDFIYMLMAFIGNAIFGFSFLFSKLAMDVAHPSVLLATRFTVAFILMSILVALKVVKLNLKGKDLKPLLFLGLMQPVIYFVCESYGIKYTSSSIAGILIALIPIAGIVLSAFLLKEAPTKKQALFSVLSVLGVIIMTTTNTDASFEVKGILFLIGAVVSGAMFSIQSRKISTVFTAFERTYVMFALGTVAFIIYGLVDTSFDVNQWTVALANGKFWISIAYLSCASSVGAFMLLNKVLDGLDVTRATVFSNVTTIFSVLAGVLILKESFTFVQALGIIVAIVGVIGVNISSN